MRRFCLLALLVLAVVPVGAQINLSWEDNSNNETGFRVYRGVGLTGTLTPYDQTGPNIEFYTDSSVVAGTTYRYQVYAFNAAGQSPASNLAQATAKVTSAVPAAVTGVRAATPSDLVNVSNRGLVTATSTTMITGFVVGPGDGARALIRVVGPTLASVGFGETGVCPDPRMDLYDGTDTIISSNDNWSGAETSDAAIAVNAFPMPVGSKDAAMVVTLQPGSYTVIARSNSGDGIVLAEVYKIP